MLHFLKIIFITLILVLPELTFAQKAQTEKEKEFFTIAPRIGVGVHNYLNCDLGISALYISNVGLQWGAVSAYSSFILQQTNWNPDFDAKGLKIGIQSSWAIFMWGVEWKNLTYNSKKYNYLSPKIGLSWLDVINLEYLVNVLDVNKECPINSRHQLSINMSLNRKIYNNIWK